MPEDTVTVLDGSTFVVGDRLGDLRSDVVREHGLFCADTRFVSHWVLRVEDAALERLGLDQESYFAAQFFLAPRIDPEEQVPCSVTRRRLVDHVWLEEVTVTNHRHERRELAVRLEIDADFADLFEVKDGHIRDRDVTFIHDERSITLDYRNAEFRRSVTIASTRPARIARDGFSYTLSLSPGERWTCAFAVTPFAAQPGVAFTSRAPRGTLDELNVYKSAERDTWVAATPTLNSEDASLALTYRASLSDLGALRLQPDLGAGATLPAAGLPWFMALFGRDSLIASYQALPYLPGLAATTLRVLAAAQAQTRDDFHEREPGKILHELRYGELTALGERPHSPYFGTADATPLFLILLDEYHRWTHDDELVRTLEQNARAALAWIEDSGDADGDGYVEYSRRNPTTGLINQCWKDSWDSIQFADGTLARGPIASCEIQGYVYDARRRAARLAREVWLDDELAERLDGHAEELQERFRRDFWMPDRGCHALALDGEKRQVDSLTSNIGHLLWSGILDEDEAAATAELLMGEQLYSGWGVRTLGSCESGYNPLGYHTGTVWPHENSLIAAGLKRYGHDQAASTLAGSVLRAATYFEHRLPEVFAGYPLAEASVPVAYPAASRPQAWAAGAALLLLSTLLELKPGFTHAELAAHPGAGQLSLDIERGSGDDDGR